MKLSEKQEFSAMFKKYKLFTDDFKEFPFGQMTFMQCVMVCLDKVDCKYLKHGNVTTNGINHSAVKNCTIWTPRN